MALSDRLSEASTILKVYTVIMLLALFMHLVGYFTVGWTVSQTPMFTFSMGLWTSCMDLIKNQEPLCAKTEIDAASKWLQVVQVLESIGLGSFILALAVALVQVFIKSNVFISYINIAAILSAGVTIDAGCFYFLVKVNFDDFGYSVSISAAAGLLALLCTCLMIFDTVRFKRRPFVTSSHQSKMDTNGHSYVMAQTQEM